MTLTPTNPPPLPPWRRAQRDHFPGVPAWGWPPAGPPGAVRDQPPGDGGQGLGLRRPPTAPACASASSTPACRPTIPASGGLEASYQVVADDAGALSVAECAPHDPAGRGTACASVIRQVAPGASISSLRVLTDGKNGSGDALLTGLRWAIEAGFDVINMSLPTTKSDFRHTLQELADRAYFRRACWWPPRTTCPS